MGEALLEVKQLGKVYPDGTEALKNINITINKKEFVSVIGPSGAGKSTFLRSINKLNDPTSGEIIFLNQNITKAKGKELRKIRIQIGMIFQGFNLVKRSQTVKNVLHGRLGYMSSIKGSLGLFSKDDVEDALEVLVRVGLEQQAFKRADELSGGQQQRVGIARAIAQNPAMILADEPIASLDPTSSENVMQYLKKICVEDGITTIVNLHQVDYAKRFSDRIIGIKAGSVVFDGKPSELTDGITHYIYN